MINNVLFTVLLTFAVLVTTVVGDVAVRTIYGTEGSCTPDEMDSIYEQNRRRNVRSRDLCSFDDYRCYWRCYGWPYEQCYIAWPCYCQRKLDEARRLDFDEECKEETDKVEGWHTSVYRELTPSCKERIDTRQHQCFEVKSSINNGADKVNSFRLWNADAKQVVVASLVDEDSFCEGDFSFSIEAVAGEKVSDVKFELEGPDGYNYIHTEYKEPYTLFANVGSDVYGRKYNAGEYNLMVTPNEDPTKAEILRFTIKDCDEGETPPDLQDSCGLQDFQNECRSTRGCQGMYSGATDCSNRDGGVCFCGSSVCGCRDLDSPPPPSSCGLQDYQNECRTTRQCQGIYSGATDCSNRDGGVCFCGADVCGCI